MGGWEGGCFQLKESAAQVTWIALGRTSCLLFVFLFLNLGFKHGAGTNKITVDVPEIGCAPHFLLT